MITIITISPRATELALRLRQLMPDTEIFTTRKYAVDGTVAFDNGLTSVVGELFATRKNLLFIMATGIVVRSIAPHVRHKTTDPAVVVMDEKATFAISLLSGHLGGANLLAQRLAQVVGATPVITTASDVHGKLSIDMFAMQHDLLIDSLEDAKQVTALLIDDKVVVQQNETLAEVSMEYPPHAQPQALVLITHRASPCVQLPTIKLLVPNIVLGIGCRKGVPGEAIVTFVEGWLGTLDIDRRCVCMLASVDIKANEPGILHAAQYFGVPVQFVERSAIKLVEMQFASSDFVTQQLGVSGVCEPSAFIAGGQNGRFLLQKTSLNGMTLAIFEKEISRTLHTG